MKLTEHQMILFYLATLVVVALVIGNEQILDMCLGAILMAFKGDRNEIVNTSSDKS
jgi:hypothetical protein